MAKTKRPRSVPLPRYNDIEQTMLNLTYRDEKFYRTGTFSKYNLHLQLTEIGKEDLDIFSGDINDCIEKLEKLNKIFINARPVIEVDHSGCMSAYSDDYCECENDPYLVIHADLEIIPTAEEVPYYFTALAKKEKYEADCIIYKRELNKYNREQRALAKKQAEDSERKMYLELKEKYENEEVD